MTAVQFHLAEDAVREEAPAALVEGDRGLVTGGLDAKDYHEARLLIFRGQVTTIPGPFPGSPGAAQVHDEV